MRGKKNYIILGIILCVAIIAIDFVYTTYKTQKKTMELLVGTWRFEGFFVNEDTSGIIVPFSLDEYGNKKMLLNYPASILLTKDGKSMNDQSKIGDYNDKFITFPKLVEGDYVYEIISISMKELVIKNPNDEKRAYYYRVE